VPLAKHLQARLRVSIFRGLFDLDLPLSESAILRTLINYRVQLH
jgi:hypothetical protein